MKIILKYIFSFFSLSLFLVSCVDDEKIRYELDDFERIVNMRINSDVSSFDATNQEAATTLTFYSENSEDVEEVELLIDHYIFLEDSTSDRVSLMTVSGNQITNDGSTTFTFTLSELAEVIGIEQSDLAGGDILTIYNITTMKNGRVYPDTILTGTEQETINISPSIAQSSPTTSFTSTITFPIVCELPEGFGTGEYLLEVVEGANTGLGVPIFDEGIVELTASSNTGRTFNVGYFSAFGFDQDITFDFACNITLLPNIDSGLGCPPPPTMTLVLDSTDPGTFDINDDSEFTISFFHNPAGACGVPAGEKYVFRLTKQ